MCYYCCFWSEFCGAVSTEHCTAQIYIDPLKVLTITNYELQKTQYGLFTDFVALSVSLGVSGTHLWISG